MENSLFLILISFGFSAALLPLARSIAIRFHLVDYPNHRKIHTKPTFKTGGIIIFIGYGLGLFLSKAYSCPNSQLLILNAFLIFLIGISGDKDWLKSKQRLLLQGGVCLGFIIFTNTVLRDLGIFALPNFLQIPFTVFAIVGVINAFNLIDGMNGLASGIGVIASLSLGRLAFLHGDNELFRLAVLFAGALLGFMVFNLRGKIFMGDSGSYLTGFIISVLSIMLVNRNPAISPFAPFLISFIPIFDTLFTIYRRKRIKNNPLEADKRHLHHILRRRYKSNIKALTIILLIQTIFTLIALLLHKHTIPLVVSVVFEGLFLRRLWLKRIRLGKVIL